MYFVKYWCAYLCIIVLGSNAFANLKDDLLKLSTTKDSDERRHLIYSILSDEQSFKEIESFELDAKQIDAICDALLDQDIYFEEALFVPLLTKFKKDGAKSLRAPRLVEALLTYWSSIVSSTFAPRRLELARFKRLVVDLIKNVLDDFVGHDTKFPLLVKALPDLPDLIKRQDLAKGLTTNELKQTFLKAALPTLHADDLEQFTKMVFPSNSVTHERNPQPTKATSPRLIVCNQEGYDDDVTINCTAGAPLKLSDGTPIGYNVHLPHGDVKAVFTSVYGGVNKSERTKSMSFPGRLNPLQAFLLTHGIAIVTLNLVDLRELDVSQTSMSDEFHARLHDSIDTYFHALNDATLDPQLVELRGKPNYLYGASFGGRTAIRHAELKPRTFAGYLSHAGALDFATLQTSDSVLTLGRVYSNAHLDPFHYIETIEKPVLLLHNIDDNNVHISVTLSWFKKALRILEPLGREHLIRLLVVEQGNPIPDREVGLHNKGHFIPTDVDTFTRMATHILRFITNGPSALPIVSRLTAEVAEGFAYQSLPRARLLDRFLSEALSISFKHKHQTIDDQTWNEHYLPIYQALAFVDQLFATKRNSREIMQIKKHGMLTDEVWKNMLRSYAAQFASYLSERYRWNISVAMIKNGLENSRDIVLHLSTLIDKVKSSQSDFSLFLFRALYLANPQLIPGDSARDAQQEKAARQFLEDKLSLLKTLAQRSWKGVAHEATLQQQRSFASFKEKVDEILESPLEQNEWKAEPFELIKQATEFISLKRRIEVRALYRKLVNKFESCESTVCTVQYVNILLSYAFLLGHKPTLRYALRTAVERLSKIYVQSSDGMLGQVGDSVKILALALFKQTSTKSRLFSSDDISEIIEQLIREKQVVDK